MSKIIKPIGHGLCAAGFLFVVVYFWGAYLKGNDALRDALNPFILRNYIVLAPLAPGVILLWLHDYIATGRRYFENR